MKLSFFVTFQKIARLLPFITLALIIVSVFGQWSLYYLPDFTGRDILAQEFNLDEEANFPSLYSALLLLLCSFLIKIISEIKKKVRDRYTFYWQSLASIFLVLSVDEILSLHENVITPLRRTFGFTGFLRFAWVVPAAIFVVFSIFFFLKFFLSLPTPIKFSILLAGFLYVGGALGMEMINGQYSDLYGEENFGYEILVTIEESLEIFGIVIMINTLLTYLKQCAINEVNVRIDFSSKKPIEMRRKDLVA
jgi:hypothetical protein